MLQIKTIHVLITLSPKPPTEQFDQRVNEALAEGWRLTKRICYETAFIAELEKEVITDEEKCCDNCKHGLNSPEKEPCRSCSDDADKWEPAEE